MREELIALEQVREEDENKLGGKSEGFEVYAKISKVSGRARPPGPDGT